MQPTDNSFRPLGGLDEIECLRVTSIARLMECPRGWKAMMLGEGEVSDSPAAGVGTAVHLHIEQFLRGSYDLFDAGWEHGMRALEVAGVIAKERQNVAAYCAQLARWRPHLLALEKEFTLPLVPGAPPVKGHIDCAFQAPGAPLAIRDHKTNRSYSGVEWWRQQWQPRLYAWAARVLWDCSHVVFEVGYVNLGEVVRWAPDPLDWFDLEAAYAEAWAEVQGSRETGHWREMFNKNCGFCPIRKDCGTARAQTRALYGALGPRLLKEKA